MHVKQTRPSKAARPSTGSPAGAQGIAITRSSGLPTWVTEQAPAGLALQSKLTINQPGDTYEQEADQVADRVLRKAEPQVQRMCACGGDAGADGECAACKAQRLGVQRQVDEEEEEKALVQMKVGPAVDPPAVAPPVVQQALHGPGRSLDVGIRAFMEPRFGQDFSHVRVHTDTQAVESARAINARAYTVGHDLVFGSGQYAPGTTEGRRLLAHELVHTMQQGSHVPPSIQRQVADTVALGERITITGDTSIGSGSYVIIVNYDDGTTIYGELIDEYGNPNGTAVEARKADLIDYGPYVPPTQAPATTQVVSAQAEGGTQSAEFLGSTWREVNELGILYRPGGKGVGGANLRKAPLPGAELITWLPPNTRVFILKYNKPDPKDTYGWYAVTAMPNGGAEFGYIVESLVARHLPDPDSEVLKVESGQSPIEIARKHYAQKGFDIWGRDKRYVVNALVWVNAHAKHNFPGETGISKTRLHEPWWTAKSTAGVYIWLPGAAYLKAIYEKVAEKGGGTGSITADLWRGIKKVYEYVAYGLAFAGGLVHGFVKSIYDAVAGLIEMVADIVVSVFTGSIVKDAKELWTAISGMTWDGVKDALGAWWETWEKKLESDDPWTAGHAHGYLTGYIMAEAAQLLLTGGAATALKAAIWGSRIGKAIKGTRAFKAFLSGMEKLGEGGAAVRKTVTAAGEALRHSRAFQRLEVAREWVIVTLKVSGTFVKDLTLDGINRLRLLSDAALTRIAKLSNRAKRWLLGCASNCKVDLNAIKSKLAGMTDDEIEKFVSEIPEQASTPAVKGGKRPTIDDKRVPTRKRPRLEAEDIPRRSGETLKDAITRINKIIGTRISDLPSFQKVWESSREHVLHSTTLTKDNVAEVYAKVRKRFWVEVRRNEDALKVLGDSGFYLPEQEGAAFLGGVKKGIPEQEFRVSLDHSFEKARGENWKQALDPDNLVFEFHNSNSYREIVQMRHTELRSP